MINNIVEYEQTNVKIQYANAYVVIDDKKTTNDAKFENAKNLTI